MKVNLKLHTLISLIACLCLSHLTLGFRTSQVQSALSSSQAIDAALSNDNNNENERMLAEMKDYALKKQWQEDDNSYHYLAAYKGAEDSYQNSKIIKNIHLTVSFHNEKIFQVKITDNDSARFEVPEKFPFPYFEDKTLITADIGCCTVEVQSDPFTFVVTRKDTKQVLFDTKNKKLVYSDLYIEFSSTLPSDNVYGFGERNYKFKLTPGTYTIWGRDDPMILENGDGGANTYSQHPLGLIRDGNGDFYITYLRNVNAMDVIVKKDPSLTIKTVGGVIDLIFFVGDDYPENVIKLYHGYIGKFAMMPFWSMGYHQSKWGYTSHNIMNDVVTKYNQNDLPLDVIWSDIDYMINKEDFTMDTRNYPPEKMKEFKSKYNKKWVPIIDAGVKKDSAQGPGASAGLDKEVFLRNYKGDYLVGSVWPGKVYFPDFFHPNTEKYWADMLQVLYDIVPFSGIWLDMNEVANFVDGEDQRYAASKYDRIPYTPGQRPLKRKTISLDAVHYGNIMEYDAHGLFGILECQATFNFLQTKSKLPFILTRASSVGLGKFAAHWGGDNGAHWEFLQYSIPGNFNFQIFGIPFVGADICGFMDGTNEELCARWTQVGALYPFARNHHEDRTRNQEPWTFTGNNRGVSVMDTTRAALKMRYSILKWYYSLFIETGGLGSVYKALMFEFPHEDELYKDGYNDWEFLLGRSLLCTPKVESGEPFVNAYFPKDTWYTLLTGEKFMGREEENRVKRVETPYNASAPLFLRAGHVIHKQKVDKVLTTEDLNDEFELVMALDRSSDADLLSAKGSIMGIQKFEDDTVYHRCVEDDCLYNIIVTVTQEDVSSVTLEIKFVRRNGEVKVPLDDVGIYGLRVYGLPLEFMSQDEKKLGYGLLEVKRDGETSESVEIKKLEMMEKNAFWIDFETTIRIQDGDVVQIELII